MNDMPDNNQNSGFTNSRNELRVLKTVIERLPVAISISRRNGDHLYHNPCFQEMFGYQIQELDKSAFNSLFVDDSVFKKIVQALEKD